MKKGRTLVCTWHNCEKATPPQGGLLCDMHRTRKKKGQDMDAPPRIGPRGGGTTNVHGYRVIYKPDHPNANKHGYMREHTFVMSEHLGRPLRDHENVHHKNGIKDDNRIENLELWTRHQPCGKRVEDLIEWAKWILKEYDNIV